MIPALIAHLLLHVAIAPKGTLVEVPWHKGTTGHLLSPGDQLTFEAKGPGVVLMELRTASMMPDRAILFSLQRDDAFVSQNEIRFVRKMGGPKRFPFLGKLSIRVPQGTHHYGAVIPTDLNNEFVVRLATTKRWFKRFAASNEKPLPPRAPMAQQPKTAPLAPDGGDTKNDDAQVAEAMAVMQQTEDVLPTHDVTLTPSALTAPDAISTSAAPGITPARIAVYDFKLDNVNPGMGLVVTDSLLAEIRKLEGVSCIGMKEIREMLSHEAQKQMLGCDAGDSCLAEIGGALGVDFLVTGSLSKVAQSHVMAVRLIDQRHAKVTGSVQRRLKAGSGQEFLLAVGPAVEELFPNRPIRQGRKRGVPKEVALRLDPPPLPTWSFWAAAGTTVAVGAAGGLFGLLARSAQGDYNDLAGQSTQNIINGALLTQKGKTVRRHSNVANGLLISAGVWAVASTLMYLFTDWEGYGDTPSAMGTRVGAL